MIKKLLMTSVLLLSSSIFATDCNISWGARHQNWCIAGDGLIRTVEMVEYCDDISVGSYGDVMCDNPGYAYEYQKIECATANSGIKIVSMCLEENNN